MSVRKFQFCENQERIASTLKDLKVKTVQDENLDGVLYNDQVTGQIWEVYTFDDFETYRKPYPKGMRIYPYPRLAEIVDVICSSSIKDEIKGACRLLLEQEGEGIEFRALLLDEIEKRGIHKQRRIYRLIYKTAELFSEVNQRDITHKHIDDVKADHKYYINLAKRASGLLKRRLFGL